MKHFYSGMLVMLALVLATVMGVVALAESAEPEAALPPAVEEAPEVEAPAEDSAAASDSTALQDALNAYNAARQSSRVESLEAELQSYVESGKLTQEQADLILNYYNEQEPLRNGVCPNCGYQFQDNGGFGRGGRMNGGRGGHGGRGGMRGMNGFNQQPGGDQGNTQTNSATFDDAWQVMPESSGFEGI